jgi:hypothetical protein
LFWQPQGAQELLRDFSFDVMADEAPLLEFCRRHRYLFASDQVKNVADIRLSPLSRGYTTLITACFSTGGGKSNSVVFAITGGQIDLYSTRVFPPTGEAKTDADALCIRVDGSGGNLLETLIEQRVSDDVLTIVQNDEEIAQKVIKVVNEDRARAVQDRVNKDRSPGQIFMELARTEGVYVKKTHSSIINHKSSPILQQVFYANESNALLRITINNDKDGLVSDNSEWLHNIIYVRGKAFDWIEGETTGCVYEATLDNILKYFSFQITGAGATWGIYQDYLYDPSRYTTETHNDVLTLKPQAKTEMDKHLIQLCVLQKPFIWISLFEFVTAQENIIIRGEISLPKKQRLPPSDLATVPENIRFAKTSNPLKKRMMMNSL